MYGCWLISLLSCTFSFSGRTILLIFRQSFVSFRNGDSIAEWVLVELQGSLDSDSDLIGSHIGDLSYSKDVSTLLEQLLIMVMRKQTTPVVPLKP